MPYDGCIVGGGGISIPDGIKHVANTARARWEVFTIDVLGKHVPCNLCHNQDNTALIRSCN